MLKKASRLQGELFKTHLSKIINPGHPLCRLAAVIEWSEFDAAFGKLYCPDQGRPAKPTRLMVGLQYLKYTFNLIDEEIVARWVENPYWKYFCGGKYFEHKPPIDPSLMTKWRNRVESQGWRNCWNRPFRLVSIQRF